MQLCLVYLFLSFWGFSKTTTKLWKQHEKWGNQMSKIKARKKCTWCVRRAWNVIVYYKAHYAQIITIKQHWHIRWDTKLGGQCWLHQSTFRPLNLILNHALWFECFAFRITSELLMETLWKSMWHVACVFMYASIYYIVLDKTKANAKAKARAT